MTSLKMFGAVAGGTVGVLVLGMFVFSELGKDFYANLLGVGLLIFLLAGALALLARSGLLK